jgi:hypothetical protein
VPAAQYPRHVVLREGGRYRFCYALPDGEENLKRTAELAGWVRWRAKRQDRAAVSLLDDLTNMVGPSLRGLVADWKQQVVAPTHPSASPSARASPPGSSPADEDAAAAGGRHESAAMTPLAGGHASVEQSAAKRQRV